MDFFQIGDNKINQKFGIHTILNQSPTRDIYIADSLVKSKFLSKICDFTKICSIYLHSLVKTVFFFAKFSKLKTFKSTSQHILPIYNITSPYSWLDQSQEWDTRDTNQNFSYHLFSDFQIIDFLKANLMDTFDPELFNQKGHLHQCNSDIVQTY